MVQLFVDTREKGGRLFLLETGGIAGNVLHAVNDFCRVLGVETYGPTDSVSDLSARMTDTYETTFVRWLEGSRLSEKDLVFVLSLDGENREKNASANLATALEYAKEVKAKVCGIVGENNGFTVQVANVCVLVPSINSQLSPLLADFIQTMILGLIVSHPDVQAAEVIWESADDIWSANPLLFT